MPPPTALLLDAWTHLLAFQRAALTELDAELRAAHGITLDQFDVLHQLTLAIDPLRVGDLASALRIAPSACGRLVGVMEHAGLVERVGDPSDRRVVRVRLTDTGRDVRRHAAATQVRGICALLREVDPEVLTVLSRLEPPPRS